MIAYINDLIFKRKLLTVILIVVLGQAIASPLSYCQNQTYAEYDLKAAFIYNFTKFIEWPNENKNNKPAMIVGIIGKDPFGPSISSIGGKNVRGKKLIIKDIEYLDNIRECDVLFIAASEKHRLKNILKYLVAKPILTIADTETFGERGVIINLYIENDKVKFEINAEAARKAGLKINPNLMMLGKLVKSRQN